MPIWFYALRKIKKGLKSAQIPFPSLSAAFSFVLMIFGTWAAPISDYAFSGWDEGVKGYIAYIVSGLVGVAIVVGLTYLFAKAIKRGE